jgi:hypothetical protein
MLTATRAIGPHPVAMGLAQRVAEGNQDRIIQPRDRAAWTTWLLRGYAVGRGYAAGWHNLARAPKDLHHR